MDLQQSAHQFNAQFKGFNLESGVPTPEQSAVAMQQIIMLAKQSELPPGGKLPHLDAIVASVAELAPRSASAFNHLLVENPSQREFAKTLELALAVMEQRSPETWKHIQNHTALTMLYYERVTGLDKESNPARSGQLLTLLVGALGHDIGKAGLDPELLHKATRIKPERLRQAAAQYGQSVPEYPEKLHDLMFLEEANQGRIIFADSAKGAQANGDLILDISKDLRRSESYWLDEAQKQRHNAIWERINNHAKEHIKEDWLNEQEQGALTMAKRGTVTTEEMKVIESHDAMSEAFFKQAPVPDAMKGVREIVSMDRFRENGTPQPKSALAEIIHATDVFEALTADRSYRRGYSPEEAMKVMDGMAKEGKVNAVIVESMKQNGTVAVYSAKTSLQRSIDITLSTLSPELNSSWVNRVLGFNPLKEISNMFKVPGSGPSSGFSLGV